MDPPISNQIVDFWSHPYTGKFSSPMGQYLYQTYYGKGFQLEIVIPSALMLMTTIISYLGNGFIIFCTVKNKNLRGSYNILMSVACFGDMLHQSCHWVYFLNMASGNNFIPYDHCFYAQALFQTGVTVSVTMTFWIGVDRLVGVGLPSAYRRLDYRLYLGGMCVASAGLVLHVTYLAWMHTFSEYGTEPVFCLVIDSMGGESAAFWFRLCLALSVLDLLLYAAVGAALRRRTRTPACARRAFRSLAALMALVVGGWLVNAAAQVLLPALRLPASRQLYWRYYFGLAPNVASAANVFVLYGLSADYRNTFRKYLGRIFPWMADQSTTIAFSAPTAEQSLT